MSDKWWLRRGDSQIQWGRNDEPLALLTVFTEDDKNVDEAWVAAVARLDSGYSSEQEEQQIADETLVGESESFAKVFGYRAKASRIRERLALMGFTAEACRHELSSAVAEMLEDEPGGTLEVTGSNGEAIASMTPTDILNRGLLAWESETPTRLLEPMDQRCESFIENLSESGLDERVLLALQLEAAPADEDVTLDLHALFLGGYFNGVDNITQLAADALSVSVSSGGPIIVVTEGVTDASLLKRALELVAPHVSHMFRFFDRDAGAEMGAAQVVRTLRSFAAAGVTNRVVGVLDNDAAGRVAANVLTTRPRPTNNRYALLPDVPYGVAYPTYGPSGEADLNINGRAVSIEFQFGVELLRVRGGDLAKVEWSGREASIGVYQGSLAKNDKAEVQRNIRAFLEDATPDHDPAVEPWPTIHALVNRLLEAATPESFPGQFYVGEH